MPFLSDAARADSGAVTLESLAFVLAEAGRLDSAAVVLERIARRPEFGWEGQEAERVATFRLAALHESQGHTAEAVSAWRRFLDDWKQADPGLPLLAHARARLAALSGDGKR